MSEPSRAFKWGSIVWAIVIGAALIALAGSVLLPSTKRARIDWDEVRRRQAAAEAAVDAKAASPAGTAAAGASTVPAAGQ